MFTNHYFGFPPLLKKKKKPTKCFKGGMSLPFIGLFRKRGVRSAECGVRSAECGVRSLRKKI